MSLPALLAGERRWWFAALVATGAVQAGVAAVSAGMISTAVTTGDLAPVLAGGLAASAVLAGFASLAERWLGEKLAQSYVFCLRESLFAAAIPEIGQIEESRLLMPFVGDLAAVRNWAARGPAALLTAGVAGAGGSLLVLLQYPRLAAGLAPLLLAAGALWPLFRRLAGRIVEQRRARGQLTRYVMRRLREPVDGVLPDRQRLRRIDRRRLAHRAERAAEVAVRRATLVGTMDGVAMTGAGCSVLAFLALADGNDPRALIAALGLAGFVAARLLDVARALHALAGGGVALQQISARLTPRAAAAGSKPPIDEDG